MSRVQLQNVSDLLGALDPNAVCETTTLDTPGDRDRQTPLPEVTEGDFFTRDLDQALLRGEADLAVHSAKDLPESLAEGLCVAAWVPMGVDWECLTTRRGETLAELPAGARIGTSSVRRSAAIAALRPDLRPVSIRGNVPDRLAQMDAGKFEGLVLSAAGLVRLGLQGRISEVFSPTAFPPPSGQGHLALVVRREDMELRRFLEPLDLSDREELP